MDTDTGISTEDDPLTEAYLLAAEKMVEGRSVPEIRIALMGKGIPYDDATRIITEVAEARTEVDNEAAEQLIQKGVFWLLGGLFVTGFTYRVFEGGGTYIIAWGAILYGALQIVSGLLETKRPS